MVRSTPGDDWDMFMKVFPVVLALAVAIGVMAELAFTKNRVYTIASAPKDSETTLVTLRGKVTPTGTNNYIITDETGSALLETCPIWYRHILLEPDEEVTVTGEVVKNERPRKGTLYSFTVFTLMRSGKPDIVLRTRPGKPPWASRNPVQE
jgi:uncharacterized protein YdeI (BOF family)